MNINGFPLFTWLKIIRVQKGQSKMFALLNNPYLFGHILRPKDVTYDVLCRIVRDRPMHVVDACRLQQTLHARYGSRTDAVSEYGMFGMVSAGGSGKRRDQLVFNSIYESKSETSEAKCKAAVRARRNAIEKLSKKKAKELESNSELRTIFYLTNELKGLLK
jgi:hypothetical protein